MKQDINLNEEIYFYDDRSKYDYMFHLETILYSDEDTAIVLVRGTEGATTITEKLVFNHKTREVINQDYYSWYATNDIAWVEEKLENMKKRSQY